MINVLFAAVAAAAMALCIGICVCPPGDPPGMQASTT